MMTNSPIPVQHMQTQYTGKRFRPFQAAKIPAWLVEALEDLRVKNASAVFHECGANWRMLPRRIGDDELFFIIKGQVHALIDGKRHVLSAGRCANFQRGILHSAESDGEPGFCVIGLHYTATIYESLSFPEVMGFPPVLDLSGDTGMPGLLKEACRECALKPPGWQAAVSALVLRLLLRLTWNHAAQITPTQISSHAEDLRRISAAMKLLRGNLRESPSIGRLARAAGFSEPHFRRVFRRALGESPVRHIQKMRIEKACHLLRTTGMTVEAIAEEVGYAETAFFAHTFRRQLGISPGRFRQRDTI